MTNNSNPSQQAVTARENARNKKSGEFGAHPNTGPEASLTPQGSAAQARADEIRDIQERRATGVNRQFHLARETIAELVSEWHPTATHLVVTDTRVGSHDGPSFHPDELRDADGNKVWEDPNVTNEDDGGLYDSLVEALPLLTYPTVEATRDADDVVRVEDDGGMEFIGHDDWGPRFIIDLIRAGK